MMMNRKSVKFLGLKQTCSIMKHSDRYEREYENDQEDEERCELFDDTTQELPVCTVRRFEMIKYSFRQDEEYVAIKEDEYEDLTSFSIWRIPVYGYDDLAEKKSTMLVKYLQSGNLEVLES
ncbi:hypothetical protein Tco_0825855 [Tanacetum coccineum]